MDFNKLTKAQLVQYCLDLEDQLDLAVKEREAAEANTNLEVFKKEAILLGQDILKLVGFVYNLGVTTGKQFHQLVEAYKAMEVRVPFLPVTVNKDTSFEY